MPIASLIAGPSERITELGAGDYAGLAADRPHLFRTGRGAARAVVVVAP